MASMVRSVDRGPSLLARDGGRRGSGRGLKINTAPTFWCFHCAVTSS